MHPTQTFPPVQIQHAVPTNDRLDAAGYDLLHKLLTYDPNARITAQRAMQHPWLEGIGSSS